MTVYELQQGSTSVAGLRRATRPDPVPGPRDVLIRVRAVSLNYRDHLIVTGQYYSGVVDRDVIPLSDGAGEVVSIGAGVSRFRPGDRVAGAFFQVWKEGPKVSLPPALGVPLDGTLAEYICLHEDGVVALAPNLSFEEAATLPCAGVTAWNALMVIGNRVKAGDTVLCQGTGGVSMLAMQFALAAGARVIVTSSSDAKLGRARALGASDGVNYTTHPDWAGEVLRITGGRGVDHIVEIGGAGSLGLSYQAIGFGGKIALIGFLSAPGPSGRPRIDPNPAPLMMKAASLCGVGVGNTTSFEDLNRAIAINGIKPVVDTVYRFDDAVQAFNRLATGDFFGKLVIAISS